MRCLSLDINGQMSRFCQQCGKFEPLEAFDGNKRYSRSRLVCPACPVATSYQSGGDRVSLN
jgi:hypothetical protein